MLESLVFEAACLGMSSQIWVPMTVVAKPRGASNFLENRIARVSGNVLVQLKLAASSASSRGEGATGGLKAPSPVKGPVTEGLEPLLSSLNSSSGTKRRQNDPIPKLGDIEEARI